MAISFEIQAQSEAPVDHVFRTIADLRSWDAFAGVELVGPERTVTVDDRIDVRLRVVRRDIRMGCVVRAVDEPTHHKAGAIDIRSLEGPFDARMIGVATPTARGCEIGVEVHGIGRGPARMLERPVEIVMRQWAMHQMQHLLALAAAPRQLTDASPA
ncbi:MAG: hypothetical protein QOC92_1959 [Acidimicrobiaceae bacterium]|jgi:hypothetical protein